MAPSQPDVEIIDLSSEPNEVDETSKTNNIKPPKLNTTITIEDSFVSLIDPFSSDDDEQLTKSPQSITGQSVKSDLSVQSIISDNSIKSTLSLSSTRSSSVQSIRSNRSEKKSRDEISSPEASTNRLKKIRKRSTPKAASLKRLQKEQDKLQKEANRANAANKALENCTTYIHKNVPNLIGDPEEISLRTLFDESMIKYNINETQKIENSIKWTYKRIEVVDGCCVPKYKNAPWTIVIMEGKDYLEKILNFRDKPEDSNTIKHYLTHLRKGADCDIILMVYNLANYLKTERLKNAKSYRKTFKDRFEGAGNKTTTQFDETSRQLTIGVGELQDLRLMLEVEVRHDHPDWKFHIEFFEKTNDIVNSLIKYSLSLAKLEVKHNIEVTTGIDWAINMDKERAVDPTKSADDLTRLWITQLQQFPQITFPMAKAIAAEYPSPCALLDQYRNLTESDGENLLSELYVQRNLRRQIGPNISKRVYCFMTSDDPNIHIGLA